jgi:hypothetical protein
LLLAQPRRAGELCVLAAVIAALCAPAPPHLALWLGLLALPIGVSGAWARAPEAENSGGSARLGATALFALAGVYWLSLWRAGTGRVTRALFLAALGAGFAHLAIANNRIGSSENGALAISLAAAGGAQVLAIAGLAGDVLRQELALRWLLDATGTPRSFRIMAAALAPTVWGLALGCLHVSLLAMAGEMASLPLHVLWGAAISWGLMMAMRWAGQETRGPGSALAAVFAMFSAAVISPIVAGAWSVALVALGAAALLLLSGRNWTT